MVKMFVRGPIFASLRTPDGGEVMPAIWCGDGDDVYFFIIHIFIAILFWGLQTNAE